jgi:hypothetical protein
MKPTATVSILNSPCPPTSRASSAMILTSSGPSPDKTVKLWKVSERDKRPEGYNLKDEEGRLRDPATITTLRVSAAVGMAMASSSLGHQGWGGHLREACADCCLCHACNVSEGARQRLTLALSLVADGGVGKVPSPNDYKCMLFLLSLRACHCHPLLYS